MRMNNKNIQLYASNEIDWTISHFVMMLWYLSCRADLKLDEVILMHQGALAPFLTVQS